MNPTWLIEDKLATFNNDTFRAELGPRRVDGSGNVVTPEVAAELESKYLADCAAAAEAGNPKPNKKDYVYVDVQARKHPKVWKLYQLVDDISHVDGKRFVRVGQVNTFDEVAQHVPEVA